VGRAIRPVKSRRTSSLEFVRRCRVKHAIEEHDVVALREPIDTWPAGTTGTVVSLYVDAALVEVAEDDPFGSALDNLLPVPSRNSSCGGASHRLGRWHGSVMEAPAVVIASRFDLHP
jgi:hypothetical protein